MITPLDIRQQTFKKSLRGFDADEVKQFLTTLSLEWEKLNGELKQVKAELQATRANLDSLKQVETVLHKTLLQAEQTSKTTIENATKDAELKMREAEAKSSELVRQAMTERSKIEMEINELLTRRNEVLEQLRGFLTGQQERLSRFEADMLTTRKPMPVLTPEPVVVPQIHPETPVVPVPEPPVAESQPPVQDVVTTPEPQTETLPVQPRENVSFFEGLSATSNPDSGDDFADKL